MIRIEVNRWCLMNISSGEEFHILFNFFVLLLTCVGESFLHIIIILRKDLLTTIDFDRLSLLVMNSSKWILATGLRFVLDVVCFWVMLAEDLVCNHRWNMLVHFNSFNELPERSFHFLRITLAAHLLDATKRLSESSSRLQTQNMILLNFLLLTHLI